MGWTRMILIAASFAVALGMPQAASAKVLEVGPDKPFKQPSEAIAAAESGDDVKIAGGQYFDCAIIKQDNLTIEDAVRTPTSLDTGTSLCRQGDPGDRRQQCHAVAQSDLQRARSARTAMAPASRAEGGDLTVENTRFINNENGILSADNPSASIRIT